VIEFARLVRLGTFFVVETEKNTHNGLERSEGNKSNVGVPSVQWKRPALVKSFAPAVGFSFCFLVFMSLAGVPGGEASGLDLFEMARALFPMVRMTLATFKLSSLYFGCASLGVNLGMVSGYVPSKIWFSMRLKKLATYFTIFWTLAMNSFNLLSPCSIKLLFTELVEKLASWDKTCWSIFKNIRKLRDVLFDVRVPTDEFKMLDELNHLDTSGIQHWNRIARLDVEESHNNAAHVGWSFNDAIHTCNFSQPFDGGLQSLLMGLNDVKDTHILSSRW
jgi:hypothetical protein